MGAGLYKGIPVDLRAVLWFIRCVKSCKIREREYYHYKQDSLIPLIIVVKF